MEALERNELIKTVEGLLEAGDPVGAIGLLRPYLKQCHSDSRANALAGIAQADNGNLIQACRHWKLSLAVDSRQYDIMQRLVRALIDLKRWEEVLPIAEDLHRERPNDKVLAVELESIRENAGVTKIGWERDAIRLDIDVRFGGGEGNT